MFILFNKNVKNKDYDVNQFLSGLDLEPIDKFDGVIQSFFSFYAPTEGPKPTCVYPLNVKELFPHWLRLNEGGNSYLISLTEAYYNWLCCNTTDINSLSFFRLEDLIDLENIPESLIEHLAYTYINSLPTEAIKNKTVSPEKVKNIIDNIKVNLYGKKGTEDSFKILINDFFGVDPDKITISYPKKYIFRLNGGRYDWMRTDPLFEQERTVEYTDFYPNDIGSYLNYSVIQDSDLWQDFSYIIKTPGISLDAYTNIIKPILHPAGTKGFFNVQFDIPTNPLKDETVLSEYELPYFRNYALYTIASTTSIGHTFGCSGAYGGITGYPIYKFPSWDQDILKYYFSGMSFGEINIGDFLDLRPKAGFTYPNAGLTCS